MYKWAQLENELSKRNVEVKHNQYQFDNVSYTSSESSMFEGCVVATRGFMKNQSVYMYVLF